MDEKRKATAGKAVAAEVSTSGNGTHPQFSTDSADLINQIEKLAAAARVDPADILSAAKVAKLLDELGTYQGLAREAALEAVRSLIAYLPTEEREVLLKGALGRCGLFERPQDAERFLASCPPPPGEPQFKPKSLADLLALPPKQWLIEQVIGQGDIGMLYGPPGSGKTFVIVDLIFSACLGRQWARRFDIASPITVAYCAGEGLSGLPARFAAAAEFYGVNDDLPGFSFYGIAPQLFAADAGDSIARFIGDWKARQGELIDLLVIDTLHSATVGADENSAQDMGKVLALARQASRELGCAVLLVHHTNKAGTGERGSSALRGAMDCMIEVKQVAGKFALGCEKLKDAEQWKAQTFDLTAMGDSVRVWWDEVGELPNSTGKQSGAMLAELQRRPGVKFTAKALAEAIGAGQSATINVLTRLIEKGQVQRSLHDEKREPSSRNPWVYWCEKSV